MDRLSDEFFYPDCPHCGAAGSTNTIYSSVNGGAAETDWKCLACGAVFNTPEESDWYGVDVLEGEEERVYLACEVRGLSVGEASDGSSRTSEETREILAEARRKVSLIRNGNGAMLGVAD